MTAFPTTQALKFAPLLLAPLLLTACGGGRPQAVPDSGLTPQRIQTPGPHGAPRGLGQRELRGLWVDAFGPGLKTPAEIDLLVADAKKMNVNVLFAQVGRRGDCYCNHAAMPRTNDPAVPAGFDPLADLLTKAHAQGIQVHAWIITTALWNSAVVAPPPGHAFHAHGPTATGRDNWLTYKADGTVRGGADWVMDPGHPDAAEYIRNMYVSVVQNYDVDGIQFDRVRYPDYNPVGGPVQWGYNPTALERYRAETGTTGTPAPADPQWSAWRRQQVTNLVRETALAVKAVRPDVSVNAATITYGAGPADEAAFQASRPYAEVGQDWLTWVKEGYLDLNVMMNYKRDFVPDQALWFDQWNSFAAGLLQRYPDVGQVSGAAIYLNDQASTVQQILKTRAAGLSGWAGYSYRTPDRDVNAGTRTKEEVLPELIARLSGEGGPFERPAGWERPNPAHLRAVSGQVTVASGPLGGRTVRLLDHKGAELARTETDGSGRYGFLRVPNGQVLVEVDGVSTERFTAPPRRVTALPPLALP
ncbi:family 10 glycosylhydrolase [Deinococcus sp. MIMF12]|uniref:Family 10 glycosylhydrolase n=1 Tax=Deinococcus rhizophilus TaxID=3049544 RepID=A0ABT7JKY6_9DEIO|nr:family 10 glycosylhydrolase [Deinococcus rhizophilus]MDL2345721.1 family 10 glycosylhydrolase [Deinococcus rhizophilus]